jgi:hypothetical protein
LTFLTRFFDYFINKADKKTEIQNIVYFHQCQTTDFDTWVVLCSSLDYFSINYYIVILMKEWTWIESEQSFLGAVTVVWPWDFINSNHILVLRINLCPTNWISWPRRWNTLEIIELWSKFTIRTREWREIESQSKLTSRATSWKKVTPKLGKSGKISIFSHSGRTPHHSNKEIYAKSFIIYAQSKTLRAPKIWFRKLTEETFIHF